LRFNRIKAVELSFAAQEVFKRDIHLLAIEIARKIE
jgi:hypothetical protein